MQALTQRQRIAIVIPFLSASALGAALMLQHWAYMPPCTWCVIQRFFFLLTFAMSVLWFVAPYSIQAVARRTLQLLTLTGALVSSWHLLDIYQPAAVEATCSAQGLMQWVDSLAIADLMPWLLAPMGDCLKDSASLGGVPLPLFALMLFGVQFYLTLNRKSN